LSSPIVSILINTFDRPALLRRAVNSVLRQSYADFEIIIIDDASNIPASEILSNICDSRIHIFRNDKNIGSIDGDRAHIKRFIHELCLGRYFVYLCDDDYWISNTLLERQVKSFEIYPKLAYVVGGQLSDMDAENHSSDFSSPITEDNLSNIFDYENTKPKSSRYYFHHSLKNHEYSLYSTWYLPSEKFLSEFCAEPTSKNIIVGATLYSREIFLRSNTFVGQEGSKWQAGYEILLGPAIYGDVVYINEPSIMVDVRPSNASFRKTQVDHYQDSVHSAELAFKYSLTDVNCPIHQFELVKFRSKCIFNLGIIYLTNSIYILKFGELGMCTKENMSKIVDPIQVFQNLLKYGGWLHIERNQMLLFFKYYYFLIYKYIK